MKRFAEVFRPTLKCPKCSHQFDQSLAQIKDDPTLVCPSCGESFKVESGGSIKDTVEALDDLDRTWDRLTKRY